MENIFRVIGTLCVFSYIVSIIMDIANIKQGRKVVQLVITLYMLAVIITPVYSNDFKIENLFEGIDDNSYKQDGQDFFFSRLEKQLENNISAKLKEENIHFENVNVHINSNGNEIAINTINVFGLADSDREAVIALLESYTQKEKIIFGD